MWIILVINYPSQTWKLWSFEGEQHIYIFLYASIRWNKIQRGRAELSNFFKENILTDSSRKTRSSRILNLGRFVLWQLYARKTKKETSFFFWKCLTILNSRSKVNNLLFILSLSLSFSPAFNVSRKKKSYSNSPHFVPECSGEDASSSPRPRGHLERSRVCSLSRAFGHQALRWRHFHVGR